MKFIGTFFLIIFFGCCLYAQSVEVLGKLKVVDGTQGAGKVFVSDGNGEGKWLSKVQYLIDLHKDLPGGGQRLYDWGYTPMQLWQYGVAYDSLMGILLPADIHGFRYAIVRLDTGNVYPYTMLVTGVQCVTWQSWGCNTTAITGANSPSNGKQNQIDFLAGCPNPPNANNIFRQLLNIYPSSAGWYIASMDEASLIYNKLIVNNRYKGYTTDGGDFCTGPNNLWWTSTEASGADESTKAYVINVETGVVSLALKTSNIRAMVLKEIP